MIIFNFGPQNCVQLKKNVCIPKYLKTILSGNVQQKSYSITTNKIIRFKNI